MIYTICKGCQYSNGISIGSPHTGKTFQEYLVKFSKSCLTLTGVKNCDGDWNKLFGWGYGLHQRNSLRLVWKSLNGKIRIGWYVYESGVRKYDGFASVEAEASTIMSITHDPASKNVLFKCGDKSVTWVLFISGELIRYPLFVFVFPSHDSGLNGIIYFNLLEKHD